MLKTSAPDPQSPAIAIANSSHDKKRNR